MFLYPLPIEFNAYSPKDVFLDEAVVPGIPIFSPLIVPLNDTSPFTSRRTDGLSVPMPTLPSDFIRSFSDTVALASALPVPKDQNRILPSDF